MRALLSVYDKTGIVDLARGPARPRVGPGVERRHRQRIRRRRHARSTDTAELTGFPAILGHRVVTLHPKIHGGILADRVQPRAPGRHGASTASSRIDLVVGNLYPFGSDPPTSSTAAARRGRHRHRRAGDGPGRGQEPRPRRRRRRPGRLRGGARRAARRRRAVRRHPAPPGPRGLRPHRGLRRRRRGLVRRGRRRPVLPPTLHLAATREAATLRYGENPHQQAALLPHQRRRPVVGRRRRSTAAWPSATSTSTTPTPPGCSPTTSGAPAGRPCAIIKHANPCGAAVADTLADAYQRAFECDARSAFGGIVALNRPVDDATAERDGRRRPGRRGHRPGLRRRRDRRAPGQAQEHPAARGAGARAAPPPAPDHGRLARAGAAPLRGPAGRLAGRHRAGAHRGRAGRRRAGLAHLRRREVELDRPGQGRRRLGIGAGQQNRVEAGQIAAEKAAGGPRACWHGPGRARRRREMSDRSRARLLVRARPVRDVGRRVTSPPAAALGEGADSRSARRRRGRGRGDARPEHDRRPGRRRGARRSSWPTRRSTGSSGWATRGARRRRSTCSGGCTSSQERFDGTADVFERTLEASFAAGDEQFSALAEVNLAEYRLHAGDVDAAPDAARVVRRSPPVAPAPVLGGLPARCAGPAGGRTRRSGAGRPAARRGGAAPRVDRRVGVGEPARAP